MRNSYRHNQIPGFVKFATPFLATGLVVAGLWINDSFERMKSGLEGAIANQIEATQTRTYEGLSDHVAGYRTVDAAPGDTAWNYVREIDQNNPQFSEILRDEGFDYHAVAGLIERINEGAPVAGEPYRIPEFE
ncbi:MAG: hypothetical protein ACQESG_08390 [Nanobdellota archaeon]